ncbi:MAG: chromosome segregation protein SMC, partial [candidate division Zixibacteria bacterium]
MLLSRLEISGFKSFPEKTIIEFDGGITGVVGPNGCGKSNILDSIRWVLGEQRTSVLRSSRMEQIIFSGTSTLNPTGMAEVTLFIKNNRGLLPIEYDDISITRRLYRSGESEYLINKNVCRLKDIIELFFDTGMGAHAYSVIQQGMIDSILSDKTEDRRSLFEEAAGVTKYKHRKKEAENKLSATEADLLRIGDVISEIEKQVVILRRQAKRANRYADQKEKLKDIEYSLTAGKLYDSEKQFGGLSQHKNELNVLIEGFTAEIDKLQVNLQENKLELTETEKAAGEFRQKDSDLAVKAAGFENEIKLSSHRMEMSTEEIQNCRIDIEALETRIVKLKKEMEDYSGRIDENERRKISSAEHCEVLDRELEELTAKQNESESDLEQKRKSNQAISERMSGVKTEITYLSESRTRLFSRLNVLEEDTQQFDKIRDESSSDLSNLDNARSGIASRIEESQSQRETLVQRKDKAVGVLTDLREKLASMQAERSGLEARRELFEQMIETGEGYTSGAAALRSWPEVPVTVYLPLAEVLEVPEQYRIAVAAALGDMGEIVPVSTYEDAYAAIEYLKSKSLGRASFLVLNEISGSNIESDMPDGGPGFLGFLDQLVSCPDEYKPAVKLLLGRVGLFESNDTALDAGKRWEHYTRVTLDGLTLLPSGFISG